MSDDTDDTKLEGGFYRDTKYLLFVFKKYFPGGGISDLRATYNILSEAFLYLTKLEDHPYNVQLVDRNTLVSLGFFHELYTDYVSVLNNSKFELPAKRFNLIKTELDRIIDELEKHDNYSLYNSSYLRRKESFPEDEEMQELKD